VLFSLRQVSTAQENIDFQSADSLTAKYYKSGDWDKLIDLGNKAIDRGIDYKYLQQRIGFALFSKENYFEARKHFEKALTFDSYDTFTISLLYYSYLNTGQEEYARYFAGRLNQEMKKSISVQSFKPLESIELEYNYKFNNTGFRSNPQYYRMGINTELSYRLILFQAFSGYNQTIKVQRIDNNYSIKDKQLEYFALLKWTISNHWSIKTAYHLLNITFGDTVSYANLGLIGISTNLNRVTLEANGSVLRINQSSIGQAGILAGYIFPGKLNIYLTGVVSETFQKTGNQFIYCQKAGFKLPGNLWVETNLTLGKMINYNDFNAMYIYNSSDPMTFRSGITLSYFLNRRFAFWTNFSFERKTFFENTAFHYNQFSYLGGLKWKL
jgi:tetratricopeptide (TPR) repeat protein